MWIIQSEADRKSLPLSRFRFVCTFAFKRPFPMLVTKLEKNVLVFAIFFISPKLIDFSGVFKYKDAFLKSQQYSIRVFSALRLLSFPIKYS